MRELLILAVSAAAAVIFVRATCALKNMTSKSSHWMRVAAVSASVGAFAVLVAVYAGSWLRELGLVGMVVGAAIASIAGRRRGDRFL